MKQLKKTLSVVKQTLQAPALTTAKTNPQLRFKSRVKAGGLDS